jgi:photosystem II stability/assembly factor-like uncharacterized protein
MTRALVLALASVCFAAAFVLGPPRVAGAARAPAVQPSDDAHASPSPSPSPGPMDALAWRSVGPALAGGRLAAIAGSDRDPWLVYIGAAGGGVWKSANGTTTWTPVFDKQDVGSIGAVAIAPRDPNDVWVGTGESNPRNDVSYGDGMYRSRDGGKTWTHLGLDHAYAISKISLDPRDPNVAVVAALGDPFADSDERGIYRTADGGKTWRRTLSLAPDSGGADLDRSAGRPNELFAAMWEFRRSSWHLTSGGNADGLFRSGDGGLTWARVAGGGFPSGLTGRIGVAIAPSDPKRVYALVESEQGLLWRSEDGGVTWRMISSNTLIDERPFYYTRIFVDPHDEEHLFATSVRLAESKNGGKTWQIVAKNVHGDHHAIWFSADGRTVLDGNDGGVALSRDGGANWEWRNNVPIEQVYRTAAGDGVPYAVCEGLQDNGAWCGPSDGRSDDGILPRDWVHVGDGDGNWTIPDPLDPDWVWSSDGGGDNGGELTRYDIPARLRRDISPYMRNQNVVPPSDLAYRFNWEAPLAFSPFDEHIAYYGGNVLFRTTDAGEHWLRISPDLTRNIKARQVLSGTPLRLDVTGAETYDTILDIAPSSVAPGTIWVSTDDGLVQLTRDGGAHWRDVTMPGLDPDARVPTIEASHADASTAYAVVDRHFTGDRAPYVYVTRDGGRSWQSIDAGLPREQNARAICEDPRDPDVLFLGLENSVWWSADRGATWRSLQQNLPPSSVRDLRVQRARGDLLAGTHGRGVWILDDITPLERLAAARRAGVALFPPPAFYQFEHDTPTFNPIAPGESPPGRAFFTFYLAQPAKAVPTLDVIDAGGRTVRRLAGTRVVDDKDVPVVTNVAGFNRVTWDLTGDLPVKWLRAPEWNRGFESGPDLLPGAYTVRLNVDGASYAQPLSVLPDPRAALTPARRALHVAYVAALADALSRVDVTLNELDNVELQLPQRITALEAGGNGALAAHARAVLEEATLQANALSSHPQNGQDNDFLRDLLRERVQSLLEVQTVLSPTPEEERESAVVRREIGAALAANAAFVGGPVTALQAALRAAGLDPLDLHAAPVEPKDEQLPDEHGARRENN